MTPTRTPEGAVVKLPQEVREQVHLRSRLCCERCGAWCPPPVGEILRRGNFRDLDNSLPNLIHLCRPCQAWMARPADAHLEGFHLERGELPAKTELRYGGPYVQEYGRRTALLREDGEVTLVSKPTWSQEGCWDGMEVMA